MNTGRVIHRRYLLQNIIERGTACVIYQGDDQVLLRTVAVKIVPAQDIPAYRGAIHATAQFSHPNITGLFDLIVEPETLYIIQEHVKGENFGKLLRSNPTPFQVCDLGIQICQALIYAGSSSHKICHGDLTPSSIIRDPEGQVRVNNFALPSDMQYFTAWSVVGGNGFVLSDLELPYGQISEGRRGDDTRSVGLLLYQLLASRSADTIKVEPPTDGILRFQRNVPRDLCDVIARAIMRTHPQRILTAEGLYTGLKQIAEAQESVVVPEVTASVTEEATRPQPFSSAQPRSAIPTGQLVSTLPARDFAFDSALTRRDDLSPRTTSNVSLPPAVSPLVNDMSMKLVAARPATYPTLSQTGSQSAKMNIPAIMLMCLVFFAIFFAVGFFVAQAVFR